MVVCVDGQWVACQTSVGIDVPVESAGSLWGVGGGGGGDYGGGGNGMSSASVQEASNPAAHMPRGGRDHGCAARSVEMMMGASIWSRNVGRLRQCKL